MSVIEKVTKNAGQPCEEAAEWLGKRRSFEKAWRECPRGDWLLWYAGRVCGPSESESRKTLVLAACDCAELALAHVPDGEDRPRMAIDTARKWARGEGGVTLADVRKAALAAAAADAASAAAASAAIAAYAAADAAIAAYAAADARTETLKRCADIVRKHYPTPPEPHEVKS